MIHLTNKCLVHVLVHCSAHDDDDTFESGWSIRVLLLRVNVCISRKGESGSGRREIAVFALRLSL